MLGGFAVKLIDKGMGVARLNFSHGSHKGHGEVLGRIREVRASCSFASCFRS